MKSLETTRLSSLRIIWIKYVFLSKNKLQNEETWAYLKKIIVELDRYPFLSAIIYFFGRRNLGAHTGYENPSGYITILLS